MRAVRVLSACALALSLAAVPTAPAAVAATSPADALVLNGSTAHPALARDDVYFGSAVTVTAGAPTDTLSFAGEIPSGINQGHALVQITPNSGTLLAVGTIPVSNDSTAVGTVRVGTSNDLSGACIGKGGSLTITHLTADAISGDISEFAASFDITCSGDHVTGVLRYNFSEPFEAVSVSPRDWTFGTQLVKQNGVPRAFTFSNRGSNPVAYQAARFSGGATADFRVRHDGCGGHTVAPGDDCTVTVVPHPRRAGGGVPTHTTLELPTTTAAVPTRLVRLEVQGATTPEAYATPGPDRIKLVWNNLARPLNQHQDRVDIYRGTSPKHLRYLKHSADGSFTETDHNVVAGRTYYYQVAPVSEINHVNVGPRSPVFAAIAWPTYSAGMYHKVAAAHLVHNQVVRAGHPVWVPVLGTHGIPKSGVSALALDVIADDPSSSTQVTVYPAGTSRPQAADLVAAARHTTSNFAITAVGAHGKITVSTAHGSTPVTLDVSGYYSAAGLSHKYGSGAAQHIFVRQGLLADTKRYQKAPLPSHYFLRTPVNFSDEIAPHVSSVLVQITAYGSKADGTISAYATDKHAASTAAVAYRAGATTTNTAIVPVGQEYVDSQSRNLPSMSFLNRGPKPVQLFITILGYYDDNTIEYGQRYTPTRPVQLLSKRVGSGHPATLRPGSHANFWTSSLNLKVAAANPSAATTLAIAPAGFANAYPKHPLLHLSAGQSLVGSTSQPVGERNNMLLRNANGHVTVSAWSFGRFQAWPAPRHTPSYAAFARTTVVRTAARAEH